MRAIASIAALAFVLASTAHAETLRGHVSVEGEVVRVVSSEGSFPVADRTLATALAPIAGWIVTVEVSARPVPGRPLADPRVVDPPRVELRGHRDGDALVLEEGGARLRLGGPAAGLVPGGRVVVVDAWRASERIVALAVEGRTLGQWTLIHLRPGDWPTPVAVVHGCRPVWLLERQDERVRVRRGDATGWVKATEVEAGDGPVTPSTSGAAPTRPTGRTDGLTDRLPR